MTFQEQFLVSRENIADLFSRFGFEVRKFRTAGGPARPIECTTGEIGTIGKSFRVYTWFACITEGEVSKTKPAILLLGDGYGVQEVTSEEEFRKFFGLEQASA